MISGLVLKYLNGECFVIRRGYETTLHVSSSFCLTVPRRILVPGQVEDDASIRLGTRDICTNLALLRSTREQNPDAIVIYKPHPDVEAGCGPARCQRRHIIAIL